MLRVTEPLLVGLEVTGVEVMALVLGLKTLAPGFGLNSLAAALNFAEVAEGGPRNDAGFCGLVIAFGTADARLLTVSRMGRGVGIAAAAAAAALCM